MGVIPEGGGRLDYVEVGHPGCAGFDDAVGAAVILGRDIGAVPVGRGGLVQLVGDADDHRVSGSETKGGAEHRHFVVGIGVGRGRLPVVVAGFSDGEVIMGDAFPVKRWFEQVRYGQGHGRRRCHRYIIDRGAATSQQGGQQESADGKACPDNGEGTKTRVRSQRAVGEASGTVGPVMIQVVPLGVGFSGSNKGWIVSRNFQGIMKAGRFYGKGGFVHGMAITPSRA